MTMRLDAPDDVTSELLEALLLLAFCQSIDLAEQLAHVTNHDLVLTACRHLERSTESVVVSRIHLLTTGALSSFVTSSPVADPVEVVV